MSKEVRSEMGFLTPLRSYASAEYAPRSPYDDRPRASRADRRFERVDMAIEVSLTSAHSFYTGIANDISEGGIFVATYIPPELGEVVQIFIELGTPRERAVLTLLGKVQWIRVPSSEGLPPGCGLKFIAPKPEEVETIRAYIARRTVGPGQ